jgi:hypothetical protein
MGGGCEQNGSGASSHCCEVNINIGATQSLVATDTGYVADPVATTTSQVQPAFLYLYYEYLITADNSDLFTYDEPDTTWLAGSDTYRLTLRIRE